MRRLCADFLFVCPIKLYVLADYTTPPTHMNREPYTHATGAERRVAARGGASWHMLAQLASSRSSNADWEAFAC